MEETQTQPVQINAETNLRRLEHLTGVLEQLEDQKFKTNQIKRYISLYYFLSINPITQSKNLLNSNNKSPKIPKNELATKHNSTKQSEQIFHTEQRVV